MRPYSLILRTNVLLGFTQQASLFNLTGIAEGWTRSIRAVGGFWEGTFTIRSGDMLRMFDEWLGNHVVETAGGMTTWEGIIYEMELTYNGVVRRRSFLDMSNAINGAYRTSDFTGSDILSNGGFETAGGGAPDVLADWDEFTGAGGNVTRDLVWFRAAGGGSASVKITSGTADDVWPPTVRPTRVEQDIDNIEANRRYQLAFWTTGEAAGGGAADECGYYAIQEPTTGDWVIPPTATGVSGNTWTEITATFTTPASGEIKVIFMAGPYNNYDAYFDDATIKGYGDDVFTTGFYINEASMIQYGRKEDFLPMDSCQQGTVENAVYTQLQQFGWPNPQGVNFGSEDNVLNVTVAGYVQTMNWMYHASGGGLTQDLSDWITAIVGTEYGLAPTHGGNVSGAGDCQFVKVGNIESNTLQVFGFTSTEVRAWDLMSELVMAGAYVGGEYVPTILWCDINRLVHYESLDTNPSYYWRDGQLFDRNARPITNGWAVRPGIVRDTTYPLKVSKNDSFFDDARDIWIEEVEVDQNGNITLKPSAYDTIHQIQSHTDYLPK